MGSPIPAGKRKVVLGVVITRDLENKLKVFGAGNFARKFGAFLEQLDEAGYFAVSIEVNEAVALARAVADQKVANDVMARLRAPAELARIQAQREADRLADEDVRRSAEENSRRRAARIAAGLPVSDDPLEEPAELQHEQGELLPGFASPAAQSSAFAAVSAGMTAPQEPDTPESSDPDAEPVF